MDEKTIQKLARVVILIKDYREEKIGLRYLVDVLEGTLLSLEERMPESFYKTWDETWTQLEIAFALDQESLYRDEIRKELNKLNMLLSEILSQQNDGPAE